MLQCKQLDSKMMELLLHEMAEGNMSFYIHSLNSTKEIIER